MSIHVPRVAVIAVAACLTGCASDPDPLDVAFGLVPVKQLSAAQQERMLRYPLGSAENPVRAHMPEGERAYLERLRCADGSRPAFARNGSADQLSPYATVMDIYSVTCGIQHATVFIDMYHPNHVEVAAVPGFTIDPGDGAASTSAQNAASPCTSAEHHEFDFWVGEWNVHGANGKLAGTNSIQREMGGCVLHERYATERGYSGESFNVYDAPRKVWHQTWVDSAGLLLLLEGGLQHGRMVLEGQTAGADGKLTRHRISWTPDPDGSVRQLWESASPNGDWTVAFDGRYTRK